MKWLYLWCCAALLGTSAFAADFTVTSPGSFFNINGLSPNPTLTLVRGKTYTFQVTTAGSHPFQINISSNVMNNNISSGTVTFRVPNVAANYSYRCSIHGFSGVINTVAAPPIRIVNLSITTNVVLRSTGTNVFTLAPEFKTNLNQTNWSALTVVTNRFALGTNETICGLPPGNPRPLYVRIRGQ